MTVADIRDHLEESNAALAVASRRINAAPVDYLCRDLYRALEAQQQALVELTNLVESEQSIGRVHRSRLDSLETGK